MPSPRITLIHATPVAHAPIWEAFSRLWSDARTVNLTDDSLGQDLAATGALDASFTTRMVELARYAADCRADAILFTCSGFGTAIDQAKKAVSVPVLKPDEAMIEEALSCGARIGGLATFRPTINSLRAELEAAAAKCAVSPQIDLRHVAGAMDALRAGRTDEHDALIAQAAETLDDCDALILAQFSMARAGQAISEVPGRRVLTSPDSAVRKLRSLLIR